MTLRMAIELIKKELDNAKLRKFTGQLNLKFNYKEGGIGSLSANIEKNLRKAKKS